MTAAAVWRWSRRLGAVALAGAVIARLLKSGRRGEAPRIARCPIHGVAYDAELEVCPECAKA